METKIKLIFCIKSLIIGGAEKVLARYLSMIDFDIYEVDLLVIYNLDDGNLLLNEIPSQVNVKYILTKQQTVMAINLTTNKRGLLDSLKYNLFRFNRNKLIKFNLNESLSFDHTEQQKVIIDFNLYFRKNLKKIKNVKKIAFSHGNLSVIKSHKHVEKMYEMYKIYDHIYVICEEMLVLANKFFPTLSDKFRLSYNPLDIELISKKAQEPVDLIDKDILNDNYFIHVSRLEASDKDFDTLINGFKLFLNKHTKYKLYLVGSGSNLEYVNGLIKSNNLSDSVILLGQKINPYPYIKNSQALILSTYAEGFPTVLIEAVVLNIPIICTAVKTGVDEIIDNPRCGLKFNFKDPIDLSSKLTLFVENKELLNEITGNLPIKQRWIKDNMTDINSFYSGISDLFNNR